MPSFGILAHSLGVDSRAILLTTREGLSGSSEQSFTDKQPIDCYWHKLQPMHLIISFYIA